MSAERVSLSIATLTVKCRDVKVVAAFWRALLDYVEIEHPTSSIRLDDPQGNGPTMLLQPTTTWIPNGRFHLDLRPLDHGAAVQRALELGARSHDIGQTGTESWTVLADPEGNEFCILQSIADRDTTLEASAHPEEIHE